MTAPDADLALRPAVGDDVDRLVALYRSAGTGPGHPHDPRSDAELVGWLGDRVAPEPVTGPRHEVWVAAAPDRLVGFVDLRGSWVSLLFVDPATQRRGVGRALLELVQALRPDGFGLRVHADNAGARAFYRELGLLELERTDGSAYDDGWPDVRLAWPGDAPLRYWRAAIDDVDAELAVLLARRVALAGHVQDHKLAHDGVAGAPARDPRREQQIVDRMAAVAPSLDPATLERVMQVVLSEGIGVWERSV